MYDFEKLTYFLSKNNKNIKHPNAKCKVGNNNIKI